MSAESLLVAERAVLARATCSHNDPLYTGKVSKLLNEGQWKKLKGRGLRGIDGVKAVSILIDEMMRLA